jgi:hypothetical protein
MSERPAPYIPDPSHTPERLATFDAIKRAWLNLAPALLTDEELDELRATLERMVAAGHERRTKR